MMSRHLRKPSIRLPLAMTVALLLGPAAAQAPARVPFAGSRSVTARLDGGSHRLARAARAIDLQETGHLHAIGEPGTTILERGNATGTFNSSISGRLTIRSASTVTATFTVMPRGGSITGRGSARFAQQGANGYFGGTISITGGTGSYAHASGMSIGISGVISRETFALTVHVHGKIHV
jgi:hypothetical protein